MPSLKLLPLLSLYDASFFLKVFKVLRSKMLSVALLFCVGRIDAALGAPIQNLTALHTDVAPAWVADPSGRGTWSLLYSCVFTLVLCVWTSIHLNVPPQDDTPLKYWMRKIEWVICALFAPEIVVFTAFQQWFQAWIFLRELNRLAASAQADDKKVSITLQAPGYPKLIAPFQKDKKSSKKNPHYNMIYAYYAVMGGFIVDISHLHEKLPRATVTTNGILFLANHGHFLQITEESIRDKSKADLLAKGLVCVQVLWVVGQTIERKAAGYPITLLEVHTIVHIVCALILYALWFQKPQDVHDPTLVSPGDFEGALAFMVLCSDFKSHCEYTETYENASENNGDITFEQPIHIHVPCYLYNWSWFGNLDRSPMPVDPVTEFGPSAHAWSRRVELLADQQQPGQIVTHYKSTRRDSDGNCRDYTINNILVTYTLAGDPPPETVLTIYSGQALASGIGLEPGSLWRYRQTLVTNVGKKVMLSQKHLTKLNMAGIFIKNNVPSDSSHDYPSTLFKFNSLIRGYRQRMLCFREANLKNTLFDYKLGQFASLLLAAAILLIPIAYGGVHLGALSIVFPTQIERLLWKIACYVLIGVAAGVGSVVLYKFADEFFDYYAKPQNFLVASFAKMVCFLYDRLADEDTVHRGLIYIILGIIGLPYVAARLYIVIEAFISIRHVPIGVYQTPGSNFMDYIPHL